MESIQGGCGVPYHAQHYLCNGKTIICDDCSRPVRTAMEGYYFCKQCDTSSCMSCTINKHCRQGSTSNSEPASSSRSNPLSALQATSDDDDDDELEEMEEPILPCAGSYTHKLEFLRKSPAFYGNSFGCNMCGEAGYGKVYHCDSCLFDAHSKCAEVDVEIKVFYHKHTLQRYYKGDDEDDDENFKCQCCEGYVGEDVSAWAYKCLQCEDFAVHARCAKYAKSLTHGSHPHKLKLVHKSSRFEGRCRCDACAGEIFHTYFYTCTRGGCNFDLHPLCAVLPSKPLCRNDPTHRVDIDYFPPAHELCDLCESRFENEAWLYRCLVCQVSMHVDCFSAETDEDSGDDEDDEEEEEDLSELYQRFIDSMDDFGNEDGEDKVDMLSGLVDSYKSSSEAAAASSFARHNLVKSRVQPKISVTQSGTHIWDRHQRDSSSPPYSPEDNPRNTYSPGGDSSLTRSSERDARDAEEERRRVKRAAKEQRQRVKAAEKEQEKQEKEARRAERAQRESKALAQLEHVTMELQRIKLSGGNDTAVAELKALTGNWQAQFARQHKEEVQRSEERHLEQTRRNEERHLETVKLHHGLAKHNQERHLHSTILLQENLNGFQEIIRTQVQSTTRVVPCLVLCTETKSKMKKVLTSLRMGIKGVHLHLFCEHAEQPHVVAGAQGCEINQKVAGDRWTNLQPFIVAGLRVLLIAIQGASMGTGVGFLKDVVPDLPKIVQDTLVLDLGRHGLQSQRGAIVPRPEEEEAAAQWLVSYLRDQKVNIGECFKLHRVRFKAPNSMKGNVGWLCSKHLDDGKKDGRLDYFPVY